LGIDAVQASQDISVFRTKANCLRVCQQGPILLVYPDGVWYRNVTPTAIEQILQDHILNNRPVEAYRFFSHCLPGSSTVAHADNGEASAIIPEI
jgi:(2Fe-2S) ferredoxin